MKTTTNATPDQRVAVIRDRKHKVTEVIRPSTHQSEIHVLCLGRRKMFGWVYPTEADTSIPRCTKCWAVE